ncbi:MAG TPA: polysaccharide deacetylase family protein [Clostridiaceae bacterium]
MQYFDRNNQVKRLKLILIFMPLIILSYTFFSYISAKEVEKVAPKNTANILHERINMLSIKSKGIGSNFIDGQVNQDDSFTDCSLVNVFNPDGHKMAYLTFDDGPSPNITPGILDILDKYKIRATFFVIGSMAEKYPDLLKKEYEVGHAIGNHTYSHNYRYIYSGTDNFMADVYKEDKVLKSVLGDGFDCKLVRFPGGSFGTFFNPYKVALTNAGYHSIDWNDLTGDAEGQNVPVDRLLNELAKYTTQEHVVILMHDAPAKSTTLEALPKVIDFLINSGYSFGILR